MSQQGLLPLTQMSNYDMYHAIFVLKMVKNNKVYVITCVSWVMAYFPRKYPYSIEMRLELFF
jgi:hypothetical protein